MFKNIKVKFAKVVLTVLALQLVFLGLGTGVKPVYADSLDGATNIQTTYTSPSLTVGRNQTFTNSVTLQGTAYGEAAFSQAYGVVVITRLDDVTLPILPNDVSVSLDSQPGNEVSNDWLLDAVSQANAGNQNMLVLGWNPFTLLPNTFTDGVTSDFDVVIKKDGVYKFQNQIFNEIVEPAAGIVSATPEDLGNVITVQAPPKLLSVTADFGGVSQTKLANESLSAVVGENVGSISAKLSDEVTLIGDGNITISGPGIPTGAPYGTFKVNVADATVLDITPDAGNDVLATEGTFTFTVIEGQVVDIYDNVNEEASFDLLVTSNVVSAIANITGAPQVGSVLTAGAVTPAQATVAYQWQVSASANDAYTDVVGANGSKYTPVATDLGKYLRVVATGTGSYKGTATSLSTTAIAAAPVTPAAVTGLTTLVDANGYVTLSWTNPPAGTYSSIRVYRVGDFYVNLPITATSYTDMATERGKSYQYVVTTVNEFGNLTNTPQITVDIPAAVVAAVASDSTDYNSPEATNVEDVKAADADVATDADTDDEDNGFPTWGILLLLVLAAVGGYLIWTQGPETAPAPAPETKKNTNTKKK